MPSPNVHPWSNLLWLWPILLVGCSSTQLPDWHVPDNWSIGPTTSQGVQPNLEWWQQLNDPALTGFIKASLKNNFSLARAKARVQEARALRSATTGKLLPNLGLTAGLKEAQNDNQGPIRLGAVDASWELDLFGLNRANKRSAQAALRAAQAAEKLTRISLVAEVVRAYASLRAEQTILASAQSMAKANAALASLAQAQADVGLPSLTLAAQAAAESARAAAMQARAEQNVQALSGQLAMLTGLPLPQLSKQLPQISETLSLTRSMPVSSSWVLATPAAVLQLRPDVQLAQAELETRLADAQAARALRWPRLTLKALLGLGGWVENTRSIGSNITLPLLDFGTLRGNARVAEARVQSAVASYQEALHTALTEVEVCLAQYQAASQELTQAHLAWQAQQRAQALVQAHTRAGLAPLAQLPTAQRATAGAQQQWANAQANHLITYANLYTALAGAIAPRTPKTP